ncbi:protein of unknown function [[Clostridium] ultunense Esp]|uniref:Uncharacterized protein n=1 Tax=[Clostridium] ultunense Esp TaxID=1288971 RepID=A0A1M4PS99_9FIRM|nr:protein of unknown function [[Clostridium] ultunense Esp]
MQNGISENIDNSELISYTNVKYVKDTLKDITIQLYIEGGELRSLSVQLLSHKNSGIEMKI